MYYTRGQITDGTFSSIERAGMDGSRPSSIITGLNYPHKIVIDFHNSRLYWAGWGDDTVKSSAMCGTDIQIVSRRPGESGTSGIGVYGSRLYWTNYFTKMLESSTLTGQDVQLLYSSESNLEGLTIVPRLDLPNNRSNDCAGRTCSKICVLAPSSFRCLS